MKTKAKEKFILIGSFGLLFFLTFFHGLCFSQIPQKINYQGYLTDSGGNPINGTVSMEFRIYDAPTGGTALWSETQNVSVSQGVYSVNLGESIPLNLSFDKPYYLGVKVGSDPEMSPRRELTSVGYSFTANNALNLTCTGCVLPSHLSFIPGDITAIYAGTGLTGGGTSGDVTLSVNNSIIQSRVIGSCSSGSSIRVINEDGSVTCETDDNSGGTVIQVNTGTGLTGGPITTSGTISLSSTYSDGSAYDSRFVNVTGDTMIGPLSLPENGLTVGSNQFVINSGKVGIGTATPNTMLDVNGRIRAKTDYGDYIAIGGDSIGNDVEIIIYSPSERNKISFWNAQLGIPTNIEAGTATFSVLSITSDLRFKKNITPIDNALYKISSLRGVNFEWKSEEFPEKGFDRGRKLGLIAQEVERILPEVVSTNQKGEKSIEYANIVALLIEAVKELKNENVDLKKRIELLEKVLRESKN